jgi:ATP-dependent DNA helicase RecQ
MPSPAASPAESPVPQRALEKILHETFGYRTLRPAQKEVIASVLARRDTLAIMPTGAGKSLCYQLPALHLPGVTIVVSPLIALMTDQVGKLTDAGVSAAP